MPGSDKATPAQEKALKELSGLIGMRNTGGRTLCCLVGPQGSGKTWLARHMKNHPEFGETKYVAVNQLLLDILEKDPLFKEIFDFNAVSLGTDLKRYGTRLRRAVHDWVAEQFLPDGLTILDHLELVFALGIDPTTTWYNDAVGNRRILLVLTGRMAGQLCRCGQHTLTRGDQPIVELEA
ncbi:MAG: ATP-binding protein [Candidatus Syntrophoarchaeum sp.]|nr:ATP-binding protein [Candidatus Syntrophoarchaeum sp.]